MLTTLAQLGLLAGTADSIANELPKPEGQAQTALRAVIRVVRPLMVFGFVIKIKMDGQR